MIGWWKRAAGWQRLWLLSTLLAFGAGLYILPALLEQARLDRLATERARVIADFERPECLPVRATPYTQLAPVPEGAPCHEMYVWRRNVTEKLPLVLDHFLFPIDAHRREILFSGMLKGAAVAALVSALLFGGLFVASRRRQT